MSTATPEAPGVTGLLAPSRSPGCGTTPPDFVMRAVITTRVAPDSLFSGLIAIESFRLNLSGSSLTLARTTASGGPPPSGSRANTNSVSSGEARFASAGEIVTVPLTVLPDGAAAAAAPLAGAVFAGADGIAALFG